MLIKRSDDIRPSEITDERLYLDRRKFVKAATGAGVLGAIGASVPWLLDGGERGEARAAPAAAAVAADDELTSLEDITSYNNFYEFGVDKRDPSKNAHLLRTRPWTIAIEGEVNKPQVFDIDAILKAFPAEERVYRLRCVEAWSMVIPWLGFPLHKLLERVEPTSQARYVEMTTLYDPEQMPGQKRALLPWPYVEGLRMDEAMHPLTLMSIGLYGKELLGQNGAPLRLVVPWKYGFKSIKSIVSMRLVRERPANTWAVVAPSEYGFYANVNPNVDHPRWSQARERRIGEFRKRDTLMFNGYAEEVGHLYSGMDLAKNY